MSESPVAAPFTAPYFQNPHPTYEWLRDHHPVHPVTVPGTGVRVWLISRHDDVRAAFTDERISNDARWATERFRKAGLVLGAGGDIDRSMSTVDPPEHTRYRKLAASTFTAARVRRWEHIVQEIVDDLLDDLLDDLSGDPRPEAAVDLLDRFATPMAVSVICEVMGIPSADRKSLREWGDVIFTADPARRGEAVDAAAALAGYMRELIAAKRKRLSPDLMSALILAHDGEGLTETELVASCAGLVIAGYETTIGLTGTAVLTLLDNPGALRELRDDPSLAGAMVDEVLRYDGAATTSLWRFAKEDIEIRGTTIPAHDAMFLLIGSANRDPRRFADPDTFDLHRADKQSLAFGHGIHRCVGAALGRLELRVSVAAVLERFSGIELAVDRSEIRYKPLVGIRGPMSLPLILRP
ncbi:cytochrome P450 family protein [Microbispora amethystogenes]|uniref:Cytochrome P450 hydroxylase n=1 Tax=Microbispora amethystogenes TaxID=1427754 RepID=A0ABQ4FIM8_9ACTN|nr:cytochrome P450 [Microbispora amethystogenes]GIH34679.1 cytochrome P450 hydroxylase [Microbispora amethystogenes]